MPHNGHIWNKSSFLSLNEQENLIIIITELTESCLGEDVQCDKTC